MATMDYKKDFKELYLPKTIPVLITVPPMKFAMVRGQGDPNGEGFASDVAALYSFSYAVKMSYKSKEAPRDYYEYTVFPLEGEWDLVDKDKPSTDKSNYKYNIMIRQPEFLDEILFERFLTEVKKKKPNPSYDRLTYESFEEGLCCQMMHLGPYDDEPKSFVQMEKFLEEQGYQRLSKKHREIYLSDPRKTASDKMKTVLRVQIR